MYGGFLIAAPSSERPVVLRDLRRPGLVVSGVPGPRGAPGPGVDTFITGATGIAVVDALPADPDPNTIYITTT